MSTNKYNKLNLKADGTGGEVGKSQQVGAWFMIRAHKYDVINHPVMAIPAKGRSKIEFPVTQQEADMLNGLVNSFQVDSPALAFRIALYETQKRLQLAEGFVRLADPHTKDKTHCGRTQKLSLRINADDLKVITKIAKKLGISNKTAARLTIINLAKGTRSDAATWRSISGCKKLTQTEVANTWKKDKKKDGAWDKDASSSMEDLKKAQVISQNL